MSFPGLVSFADASNTHTLSNCLPLVTLISLLKSTLPRALFQAHPRMDDFPHQLLHCSSTIFLILDSLSPDPLFLCPCRKMQARCPTNRDSGSSHPTLSVKASLEGKDEVIFIWCPQSTSRSLPPKYLAGPQAAGNTYLFGLLTPRSAKKQKQKKKTKKKTSKHRIIKPEHQHSSSILCKLCSTENIQTSNSCKNSVFGRK